MSNFVFFSHPIVLTALNLLYLKAEYYPPNFFFSMVSPLKLTHKCPL